MAAILRRTQQRLASQFVQQLSRGMASFGSARPGEPTPPISDAHRGPTGVLEIPQRFLMGPGPANADPRVLNAQSLPLLGHMHPPFIKIMDEVQQGLRYLFQTDSPYTLCASGTGHAGMEMVIANLLEPGEKIVVGNNGIWGSRVCDMAGRFAAEVVDLQTEAGTSFSLETLTAAVEQHKPAVLFLVQGESSTGVHQSLAGVGEMCYKNGTLLVVDSVAALGGVPFYGDAWGVDALYTGSQKCLSAPPGAAPLFLSQRAIDKLNARKTKVRSYYLDLHLVGEYWGLPINGPAPRAYHHTGMTSMWYAMREALAVVAEEGLEAMWARHEAVHKQLWAGLSALGLEPYVEDPKDRLVTVNTIKVPAGVDWAAVCKNAMDKYNLEIAGGLGPTAGKIWRIGLMGYNARPANVELVLAAFRDGLQQQGFRKA